jgi:hypothetical protein
MRVLLDHCMPKQFGRLLIGHEVQTTSALGWSNLSNGKLLDAGADRFDVLVTVDRNLQFQQHTGALPMAVFTLVAVSNRLRDLEPFVPEVLRLLSLDMQKRVYVLERQ